MIKEFYRGPLDGAILQVPNYEPNEILFPAGFDISEIVAYRKDAAGYVFIKEENE